MRRKKAGAEGKDEWAENEGSQRGTVEKMGKIRNLTSVFSKT